jgi:hypothetical protein
MLLKAFDHGAAELFRYPDALRHPRINVRNLWIAYTWIIVTGVDERNILRDRIKQVLRELGYRWERDRYNNDAGGLDSSARVSTAVAPISSVKALTPSRPLEFATRTSCPAALNLRARVPPMLPVPMTPIFIAPLLSCASFRLRI